FGCLIEPGSRDYLEKKFMHLFSSLGVHRAVHTNYSTEGGYRIAFERLLVGLGESLAGGGAARIGVLNDGTDGLVELLRQVPGRSCCEGLFCEPPLGIERERAAGFA